MSGTLGGLDFDNYDFHGAFCVLGFLYLSALLAPVLQNKRGFFLHNMPMSVSKIALSLDFLFKIKLLIIFTNMSLLNCHPFSMYDKEVSQECHCYSFHMCHVKKAKHLLLTQLHTYQARQIS